MNVLLKKDLTLRIVSVLFALALWFIVNPLETVPVNVKLEILHEDSLKERDIIIKNNSYPKEIKVMVRVKKDNVQDISPNDFKAVLDLSKIKSLDDAAVTIDGPTYLGKINGISIENSSPTFARLELEKLERKTFRIKADTQGTMKPNYKAIVVSPIPDIVSLKATSSQLQRIESVRTVVNVGNLERSVTFYKQNCKVYDRNGKEIEELSKNLSVDVKVEVAKEVAIVPVVDGKPASNYTDGARSVSPEKALITGAPEVLAGISELKTEKVSINNNNRTVEKKTLLKLPPGVSLVDTPREVLVGVVIEPMAVKEFAISRDAMVLINSVEGDVMEYTIQQQDLLVRLRGPRLDLEKVSGDALKPFIDVAGLEEGVHNVALNLSLPDGISLSKDYTVEVTIKRRSTPERP